MRCCYLSFGVLFLPKKVNSTLFHINRHQINPQTSHLSGTSVQVSWFKKREVDSRMQCCSVKLSHTFVANVVLYCVPSGSSHSENTLLSPGGMCERMLELKKEQFTIVFFVDFFNVNKPSNGAFKIEPFVRRLRGVRELRSNEVLL